MMFSLSFVEGSKSISGYRPRGSKSASGYGPGGQYPLADLDGGIQFKGIQLRLDNV